MGIEIHADTAGNAELGTFILGGGGKYSDRLWRTLATGTGTGPTSGHSRHIFIDTSATLDDNLAHSKASSTARRIVALGGSVSCIPRPLPPAATVALHLDRVDGVWFTGGTIGAISHRYSGTAVEDKLCELIARGGVVGGTSAGAVALCECTWNQHSVHQTARGLRLVPGLLLCIHATEMRRSRLCKLPVPVGHHKLSLDTGAFVVLPLAIDALPFVDGDHHFSDIRAVDGLAHLVTVLRSYEKLHERQMSTKKEHLDQSIACSTGSRDRHDTIHASLRSAM